MSTYTTVLSLEKFATAETGWGKGWNTNLDIVDHAIGTGFTPSGGTADRPASPQPGDTFLDTDTGEFLWCLVAGTWTSILPATMLPAGGANTGALADSAITEDKLADGAITTTKLQPSAIEEEKIAGAAVTTTKIADGAVTEAKLADSAVDAGALAAGAVTTAQITGGAVGASKVSPGAVTSVYTSTNSGSDITTTSTTWTDTGHTVTFTCEEAVALLTFTANVQNEYYQTYFDFDVDGSRVGGVDGLARVEPKVSGVVEVTMMYPVHLSAGTHTVKVSWRVAGSESSIQDATYSTESSLHVIVWER